MEEGIWVDSLIQSACPFFVNGSDVCLLPLVWEDTCINYILKYDPQRGTNRLSAFICIPTTASSLLRSVNVCMAGNTEGDVDVTLLSHSI